MKSLNTLHTILALIPFLSMACMLLYLMIAILKLGYIPTYGTRPDPSAFGLEILHFTGGICFIFSLPAICFWLILTEFLRTTYKPEFRIRKMSTFLLVFSIILFFIMKYCFSPVFLWYFD